ncbi:MAG: hypothetical protein PW792_00925 [Acidobacteriaceae bacterium]|nr:hypothetical protein [Acidobacteriaceae bacterium]
MGRNLYILAGTLGALALISFLLSVTHLAQGPGSPGDAALWRTSAMGLLLLSLLVGLGGTMSALFEQAERRHEQQRDEQRRQRREDAR